MDKFERDLYQVYRRIRLDCDAKLLPAVRRIKRKLVKMHRRGLVKINHSAMELVCAQHLLEEGYAVDVEYKLNNIIVCDLYGVKPAARYIVEIETGFIPPDHAVDPGGYIAARTISKIARYSAFADFFALAMPQTTLLPIPDLFLKTPEERKEESITILKNLCDLYYTNPPVSREELRWAKLNRILSVDVDHCVVSEVNISSYFKLFTEWAYMTSMYSKDLQWLRP